MEYGLKSSDLEIFHGIICFFYEMQSSQTQQLLKWQNLEFRL